MSSRHGDVPLRCRAVAVALIAGAGEAARILLLRRAGPHAGGAWGFITGGIDPGEAAPVAARREIVEETGIEITDLLTSGLTETFYFAPDNAIDLMPIFVALLPAQTPVTLDHGSDDYRWCSLAEAQELMSFAGQRRAIADIWHDFVQRAPAPFRLVPR
nr:NUDIX domain-containing protein [uncultured Dongia sp.]